MLGQLMSKLVLVLVPPLLVMVILLLIPHHRLHTVRVHWKSLLIRSFSFYTDDRADNFILGSANILLQEPANADFLFRCLDC